MRTRVVATAGHVDHGKSSLVQALTGTDPDRLAEEKARGLTIDLGFAHTQLPGGDEVSFVDVPGHVRFLRNMLAGVGAVDACVFVVSASEGWKAQSEEHLRILEVLGHRYGLVALTMADLVDDDTLDRRRLEVADHLAGSFLDGAEVVAVDSISGRGLDDVRAGLDRLLARTPAAAELGRPRLWVDRSFAVPGAGTVATGTLTGSTLRVDDELVVAPSGRRVRIRALQSHGQPTDWIGPGHRVAANLAGIRHRDLGRGDVLVRAGQWHHTTTVDAELTVLAALDHAVSRRGAYLAYVGAAELAVQLRVLGRSALEPGHTGAVRLHLPEPLPLLPGDRFVLRDSGRQETVGGGQVLDVDPVLPAAQARPDRSVDRVIRERGWVDADQLERLTGQRRPAVFGPWVVDHDTAAAARDELLRLIEVAGPSGVDVSGLDDRRRAVLETLDGVHVAGGRASTVEVGPAAFDAHPYLAQLRAAPLRPPTPAEAVVPRPEVRELVRQGLVVEVDGICFATEAVEQACRTLAARFDDDPSGLSIGEIRDTLGTSRKYVVALLTHLDATGRTRRRGDLRVAGPRLRTG